VEHVPSEKMIADALTKPLQSVKHKAFLEMIGLGK